MPEAPTAPPPAAPPADKPSLPADSRAKPGSPTFSDKTAFDRLDAFTGNEPEPAPEKARKPDGTFDKAPKAPEPKPEPTKAKVEDKVPEKPKPESAPKQLREAYETLKTKHAALEKEYGEYKTKSSQPKDDPEKKTLSEKLTAREKRLAEVERQLRNAAYSKTEEFQQKFNKPYTEAYLSGQAKIASLKIREIKDDETGQVTQQGRQATPEDFDYLMKISDDNQVSDLIDQWFGNRAPIVMYHREQVKSLATQYRKALEDAEKNGDVWEKQQREQREAFDKSFNETVETHSKAAVEKYPKWFKADETDTKAGEALERGNHLVARLTADGAPIKDGEVQLTPQELAQTLSAVRLKAGAFDHVAYKLAQSEKRNAELEKELAEYKQSEPGTGDGKRGQTDGKEAAPERSVKGALQLLQDEYSSERPYFK